jgi:hypothetical protein
VREESEPPARRNTECKTALPLFISLSKTESLPFVEGGAVIMEDITEIEVHVAKPKRSASVVAEVSWTTWRPRGVVVGVVMMRFVC